MKHNQGELVLPTKAAQKLGFKNGDLLVVIHDVSGRVILQKQARLPRAKGYLNPPPLSAAARARLYAKPDAAQDKFEAEAAALGRRALAGHKLKEL